MVFTYYWIEDHKQQKLQITANSVTEADEKFILSTKSRIPFISVWREKEAPKMLLNVKKLQVPASALLLILDMLTSGESCTVQLLGNSDETNSFVVEFKNAIVFEKSWFTPEEWFCFDFINFEIAQETSS